MAKICLPKDLANKFRQALKNGEVNPSDLSIMTSKERNEFFTKLVGEEFAQMTNSLFESKLLLKNQQQGLITWAKTVAGLKPEVRRDLLTKIEKMDRVLTPETEAGFLEDLAATKLGVSVTEKEAADITALAREASDAKVKMEGSARRGDGDATPEEIDYGQKTVALNNYVNDLKVKAERITPRELLFSPKKAIIEAGGLTKSLKSSMDVSALLRQGIKTVFSNPKEWVKNAPKTFKDIVDTFKGKEAMDNLNAEIISDPMYDKMRRSGLAVGAVEEAFPNTSPTMIPKLGTFFKASDAAYSGFLHRMRFDLFKKFVKKAEAGGVNINNPKELESIAKMVNSLTGRGHLGAAEGGANTLNALFFSPRNLKSHIDTLTAHQFQKGVTPFVRQEAAKNLMKTIAGIGTVLYTAQQLWGDDAVETDARSADFGKIKIGDTRFDVSGGMSSLATLVARMGAGLSGHKAYKNSNTGKLEYVNTGKFGTKTLKDILYQFGENKASPLLAEALDRIEGKTFDGDKPTWLNTAKNLLLPLSVSNYFETKEEKEHANLLITTMMDALGIGTSTY